MRSAVFCETVNYVFQYGNLKLNSYQFSTWNMTWYLVVFGASNAVPYYTPELNWARFSADVKRVEKVKEMKEKINSLTHQLNFQVANPLLTCKCKMYSKFSNIQLVKIKHLRKFIHVNIFSATLSIITILIMHYRSFTRVSYRFAYNSAHGQSVYMKTNYVFNLLFEKFWLNQGWEIESLLPKLQNWRLFWK